MSVTDGAHYITISGSSSGCSARSVCSLDNFCCVIFRFLIKHRHPDSVQWDADHRCCFQHLSLVTNVDQCFFLNLSPPLAGRFISTDSTGDIWAHPTRLTEDTHAVSWRTQSQRMSGHSGGTRRPKVVHETSVLIDRKKGRTIPSLITRPRRLHGTKRRHHALI